jgi:uncharacterized RDD family membrane protein YckC
MWQNSARPPNHATGGLNSVTLCEIRIMKCESCGNELIGAAIICRACNHNNALHKRHARRRPEPRHNQSTRPLAGGPPTEIPTIVPRKDSEVNLLHFPSALNRRAEVAQSPPAQQSMSEGAPQTTTLPPWRAELKERVRQIKEKRATSDLVEPNPSPAQPPRPKAGPAKLGRNPIVEAALNRIRWAERERKRRGDGATGRRGDEATERQGGIEKNLSAPTSPGRPVAPSPNPSAPTPLHLSAPPSLRPSVSPSRAAFQTSIGKPAVSGPSAGASGKQVKTRVPEISQALDPSRRNANPAPPYARLLAGACDFEIVFVAFLLLFGAYATSHNGVSFGYGSRLSMALLLSAVVFTYQVVMLAFAGRTFGMALLKLNLVNADDESLSVTLWQKLLRASAATIVFICFPLYLTAWFSASRRTLPDLVSGTTVA